MLLETGARDATEEATGVAMSEWTRRPPKMPPKGVRKYFPTAFWAPLETFLGGLSRQITLATAVPSSCLKNFDFFVLCCLKLVRAMAQQREQL